MAARRTGASHAIATARATAAAAMTLGMVAIPTSPADAFVNPPAAFPSPSSWGQQRGTATTRPASSSTTPTATALFSGSPIAPDASECDFSGARSRFATGRERRHTTFTRALGRPLHSSSPGGDTGAPERGDGAEDEDAGDATSDGPPPGMPDSEKLREKLETIAKTAAPVVDDVASGGLTTKEQEALEELQEDRRVEEELERMEARQKAKSMDPYLFADDEEEEDPDAGVRAMGQQLVDGNSSGVVAGWSTLLDANSLLSFSGKSWRVSICAVHTMFSPVG